MSYKYNYFFESLHLQIRLENNIIKKFVKKFAGSKKSITFAFPTRNFCASRVKSLLF